MGVETTRRESFTESLSSQERLDENGGKQGDNNDEMKFMLLRKERRSSGSREGENMRTAFKDLEQNCEMKRELFFLRVMQMDMNS